MLLKQSFSFRLSADRAPQLKAISVMLLPPESDVMKTSKLLAIIYLVVASISFLISAGEGYWGIGSTLSLLLTLPWSLTMVVFVWALIHDGARSLLICLIPFALLNCYLLCKMPGWWKKDAEPSLDARSITTAGS